MKKLYLLVLLAMLLSALPSHAATCSGSNAYCNACSNCKYCGHCSGGGGTCAVCVGSSGSSDRSSSNDDWSESSSDAWSPPPRMEPLTEEELRQRDAENRRVEEEYRRAESARNARINAALQREARRQAALQRQREAAARQWASRQRLARRISATRSTPATTSQRTSEFSGKCVGVADGDTISVMHHGRAERIRLYGIDCPEKAQPFGTRAKQFASNMVFGKEVKVFSTGTDRYGRTLGWVFEGKGCLNRSLVEAGLAWHYKQYAPKESKLAALEQQAKSASKGLWSDCCAVPPWEWRRGKRPEPTKANVKAKQQSPGGQSSAQDSQRSSFDWHILVPIGFVGGVAYALYRPRRRG